MVKRFFIVYFAIMVSLGVVAGVGIYYALNVLPQPDYDCIDDTFFEAGENCSEAEKNEATRRYQKNRNVENLADYPALISIFQLMGLFIMAGVWIVYRIWRWIVKGSEPKAE